MPKILNQSGLDLGVNLFLHIQSEEGTDFAVDAAAKTITRTAGDFTAVTSIGGIEGSGFTDGDEFTYNSPTNKFVADIVSVTPLVITYANAVGDEVTEAAGVTGNIQRNNKFVEYREANGLSFIDGVDAPALHSKMVNLRVSTTLDKYDPLSGSIEPRAKSLYFLNDWDWFNIQSQKSHRGGAVQVQKTKASPVRKIYTHITAPETVDTTDQWVFSYSEDAAGTAGTPAVTTGYMDEIELVLDVDNDIDKRGKWAVICAEAGKTIPAQEIELLYAETVGVTVTNAIDPILGDATGPFVSDATIEAGGPYANITISKNQTIALCSDSVGVINNQTITAVGANIVVSGMAGATVSTKATGSIDLTALPDANNTVTLNDGTNPAITFEFITTAGDAVTGSNVPVVIGADMPITLTTLVKAINDEGDTLDISANQGLHVHDVEGTNYDFGADIEYDNQDYVIVHTKLNWFMRQSTNINSDPAGPVLRGDKQPAISVFVGSDQTIDGFPINYLSSNSNDINMLDQCGEVREFNTIGAYTIRVPAAFIGAEFTVYTAATHGTSTAAIVTDASGTPQAAITIAAENTSISYAYSTFNGGGHAPGTDLDISISVNFPGTAEAEVFEGNTIKPNTTQVFQLAPAVDPSYVPPSV